MSTRVCTLSELSNEKLFRAKVDGVSVCLVCDQNQKVFAFENVCTHADLPLHAGPWDPANGILICAAHGAAFSVFEQGAVKHGPAVSPLFMCDVEVIPDENGLSQVYVSLR